MTQFIDTSSIDRELKKMLTAFQLIGSAGFPATQNAAGRSAAYIEQTWVAYASGNPIPGHDRTVDNVQYRNSITKKKLGDLDYVIFIADDKIGDRIEEDSEEVDLKEHLPFKRSRISKEGKAYSHIPFRHKRGALGKELGKKKGKGVIVKKVTALPKSYRMGSFKDDRGIKRYTYKWAQRNKELDKELKGTRLAGIVRFETSTGKKTSSAYMTFRTISQNSPAGSWIIKPKPGIPLSEIVERETRGQVNELIRQGIDRDLSVI